MARRLTTFGIVLALVTLGGMCLRAADQKETRRPLRVLLFASGPTREYQFLRSLLVQEMQKKSLELSIHVQPPPGREKSDGVVTDLPPERNLASFPTNLDAFDVIVAFDADWGRLTPEASAALKKWVETKGGGLVLVAGPINTKQLRQSSDVSTKLKPLLELCPVVLEDSRLAAIDTDKPRRLHFPAPARERAFLTLDDKNKTPLAGWEEFFTGRKTGEARGDVELRHGFFSYYPAQSVKDGAVVLATVAEPKAKLKNGSEQPFLVARSTGKGQVIYLSSGETWRLRQQRPDYHKRFWLGLLAYAGKGAISTAPEKPEKSAPVPPEKMSATDLKLEVQALQMFYNLKLTAEQMRYLATLAPQTAAADRRRQPGKASDEYRQVLIDLRTALIDANDEDNIDELQEKLAELTENEQPALDADIETSLEARRRSRDVVRRLKASQIAHYIAFIEDDVLDPREHLFAALESAQELQGDAWKNKREEVADEIGWLVAGIDTDKSGPITEQVLALLDKAHVLTAEGFKTQKKELEQKAEQIIGDISPIKVLHHTVEHALAEMLSNPRLSMALKARLKDE